MEKELGKDELEMEDMGKEEVEMEEVGLELEKPEPREMEGKVVDINSREDP